METKQKETVRGLVAKFITPPNHITLAGETGNSFSIEASGVGSLVGLAYKVPAHTKGKIKAKLSLKAFTSQDVDDLNKLAMGMLDASYKEEIKEHEKTSVSANLSLWSWFFGGDATASYEKTRDTMISKGLNDEQINMLMDAFLEIATRESTVEIDFEVDNTKNDYSVFGSLYLYTISGKVKMNDQTYEYRMLADSGNAGAEPESGTGAPAKGKIISLN